MVSVFGLLQVIYLGQSALGFSAIYENFSNLLLQVLMDEVKNKKYKKLGYHQKILIFFFLTALGDSTYLYPFTH